MRTREKENKSNKRKHNPVKLRTKKRKKNKLTELRQ